jgi:hypothetical protein
MAKISCETAEAVAEKLGLGLKIKHALAAVGNIEKAHWDATLVSNKQVRDAFEHKLGLVLEALTVRVRAGDKGWQASAWVLERVHGYTTAQNAQVQINFQTLNGVPDEVWERAKAFTGKAKPVEVEAPRNKLTGLALTAGDAE